jgi:hypothetical protein
MRRLLEQHVVAVLSGDVRPCQAHAPAFALPAPRRFPRRTLARRVGIDQADFMSAVMGTSPEMSRTGVARRHGRNGGNCKTWRRFR